jgi:galactose mutarotase-like enzyme
MEAQMPKLWNKDYTKAELSALTSAPSALAGLRLFVYEQGRIRGMRGIEGWTGSGLRFTLWPDRGLDIGPVWFKDIPIAWIHPGLGTPQQFEPTGLGWLRTFGGGLLTTCGLTHIGPPEAYDGQDHGLHGRAAHLPADNLRLWQDWQGEDYLLAVEGDVQQAVLFGENMLLRRRIETQLGSATLTIKDTVINLGSRTTPLAMLYHCNLGFPIVSADSYLIVDDFDLQPRTEFARAGLAEHANFTDPIPDCEEQVYFHFPKTDSSGYATATIFNPVLQLGFQIRWDAKTLPVLTQWKLMGAGEYVCGLEPATHAMAPQDELIEQGLHRRLSPGEQENFELNLSVIDNI